MLMWLATTTSLKDQEFDRQQTAVLYIVSCLCSIRRTHRDPMPQHIFPCMSAVNVDVPLTPPMLVHSLGLLVRCDISVEANYHDYASVESASGCDRPVKLEEAIWPVVACWEAPLRPGDEQFPSCTTKSSSQAGFFGPGQRLEQVLLGMLYSRDYLPAKRWASGDAPNSSALSS